MSGVRTLQLGQMSICVSLFDLYDSSVVSSILLYYTCLPLCPYHYPTKAGTLIKAPFYSKHMAEASVSCGHISSLKFSFL